MLDDKQPEKAKVELLNLYQTFFFIDTVTDPRSLAMACCVHSIDGKVVESIAGDTLKDIAAQLDEWMTKAERDDITNSVKKNRDRTGLLFSRAYRHKRRDAGTPSPRN